MENKQIISYDDNQDFLKKKWDLVNEKIIRKLEDQKQANYDFNNSIYYELIDKIRVKKNSLQDMKNLMLKKINKIKKNYILKIKNLEWKKRNFQIKELDYRNAKNYLDLIFFRKIKFLKKKYKLKYEKFQRIFLLYKNKIKQESILLKNLNMKQEINFNKKIDQKIILTKNQHQKILNKNKIYLEKTNNYFYNFFKKINGNYNLIKSQMKKQLAEKHIGEEIYEAKLKKIKSKCIKKSEKEIKKYELFSTPIDFKIAQLNSNTKIFGNYYSFKSVDKKIFEFLNSNKLIVAIIIFSLIVGFINPAFFKPANWFNNIMGNNVYFGLLAIGMTFVILVGGIDLSVGSGLAFSGSVILILAEKGLPIYVAILIGIIASTSVSILMGFIISYGKFQAFIVTLVGLLVLGGINRVMLGGSPISIDNSFIDFLGMSINGIFPISLIIFIAILFIAFIILKWTKYGRKIYATGSNADAAHVSGINVKWIVTSTFLISGFTVGLASLVFISQIKSVSPVTGSGFELDAIAAVVLGGTSLTGGKGSIIKTAIGWLVISMLGNIFIFLGLDSNIQLIAKGAIILIAIFLDTSFNFKKKIVSVFRNISYQFKIL